MEETAHILTLTALVRKAIGKEINVKMVYQLIACV